MMKSDLTERYIYAVTKKLPYKTREDVARELRTLIDDMLKERCGDMMPTDKDVKVVLTELGTPTELYEQYAGDGKRCLIGPNYYNTYLFVLKLVLICETVGLTVAAIVSAVVNGQDFIWYQAIMQWVGMLFSGAISAFGFVTALFAFFEYKEISLDTNSSFDDLPPVPKKEETISKGESIFGIAISVIFLVVFLICPEIFMCGVVDGKMVPIFSTQVIRNTWYILFVFSALGITGEVVKLLDGKYTKRVMLTTVITDVLSAICAVWWLSNKNIINPEFASRVGALFEGDSAFLANMFANFQYFFMGVILFALLLDCVVTFVKWMKYSVEK
ncbi:MAG: hypothetical protein IJO65_10005 [Lachnospiraceae bacterium]|nr:hypothetical protein [Lachnospiraceae bacterium]